jgi:hypothetical protein
MRELSMGRERDSRCKGEPDREASRREEGREVMGSLRLISGRTEGRGQPRTQATLTIRTNKEGSKER